jgi:hypothetical protein
MMQMNYINCMCSKLSWHSQQCPLLSCKLHTQPWHLILWVRIWWPWIWSYGFEFDKETRLIKMMKQVKATSTCFLHYNLQHPNEKHTILFHYNKGIPYREPISVCYWTHYYNLFPRWDRQLFVGFFFLLTGSVSFNESMIKIQIWIIR